MKLLSRFATLSFQWSFLQMKYQWNFQWKFDESERSKMMPSSWGIHYTWFHFKTINVSIFGDGQSEWKFALHCTFIIKSSTGEFLQLFRMAHTTFLPLFMITILQNLNSTSNFLHHSSNQLVIWQIVRIIVVIFFQHIFHKYTCCAVYQSITNTF